MQLLDGKVVRNAMAAKGYGLSQGGDYNLNFFGIRAVDLAPDYFNDLVGMMYFTVSGWVCYAFPATTDPGIYYRQNPMNVHGTAVLKPGQYPGAFQLGLHKGLPAFVQAKPLTVYRDQNRNATLELDETKLETGMFGIDIHRANSARVSTVVDKWSAGCQVIADPEHMDFLLTLAKLHVQHNGPYLTYTLLNEDDLKSI